MIQIDTVELRIDDVMTFFQGAMSNYILAGRPAGLLWDAIGDSSVIRRGIEIVIDTKKQ
jgi:hypothetical protein